ncbi:hypothetical protein CHU98_g12305 [Xylaria longipes]|nr:hypothetical protein CHU98_g12305 [Xylaria longipes]
MVPSSLIRRDDAPLLVLWRPDTRGYRSTARALQPSNQKGNAASARRPPLPPYLVGSTLSSDSTPPTSGHAPSSLSLPPEARAEQGNGRWGPAVADIPSCRRPGLPKASGAGRLEEATLDIKESRPLPSGAFSSPSTPAQSSHTQTGVGPGHTTSLGKGHSVLNHRVAALSPHFHPFTPQPRHMQPAVDGFVGGLSHSPMD